MAPCKSTAKEVSFERSQHVISSTDTQQLELHYMSPQLILEWKSYFMWRDSNVFVFGKIPQNNPLNAFQ